MELLAELVSIDSIHPGLVDQGHEARRAIVEHLRLRVERAGFATQVVSPEAPSGPAQPARVVRRDCSRGVPVLNGHVDTVGVTGMAEPFSPRSDGERLFGRGAADMKGGVAGTGRGGRGARGHPVAAPRRAGAVVR